MKPTIAATPAVKSQSPQTTEESTDHKKMVEKLSISLTDVFINTWRSQTPEQKKAVVIEHLAAWKRFFETVDKRNDTYDANTVRVVEELRRVSKMPEGIIQRGFTEGHLKSTQESVLKLKNQNALHLLFEELKKASETHAKKSPNTPTPLDKVLAFLGLWLRKRLDIPPAEKLELAKQEITITVAPAAAAASSAAPLVTARASDTTVQHPAESTHANEVKAQQEVLRQATQAAGSVDPKKKDRKGSDCESDISDNYDLADDEQASLKQMTAAKPGANSVAPSVMASASVVTVQRNPQDLKQASEFAKQEVQKGININTAWPANSAADPAGDLTPVIIETNPDGSVKQMGYDSDRDSVSSQSFVRVDNAAAIPDASSSAPPVTASAPAATAQPKSLVGSKHADEQAQNAAQAASGPADSAGDLTPPIIIVKNSDGVVSARDSDHDSVKSEPIVHVNDLGIVCSPPPSAPHSRNPSRNSNSDTELADALSNWSDDQPNLDKSTEKLHDLMQQQEEDERSTSANMDEKYRGEEEEQKLEKDREEMASFELQQREVKRMAQEDNKPKAATEEAVRQQVQQLQQQRTAAARIQGQQQAAAAAAAVRSPAHQPPSAGPHTPPPPIQTVSAGSPSRLQGNHSYQSPSQVLQRQQYRGVDISSDVRRGNGVARSVNSASPRLQQQSSAPQNAAPMLPLAVARRRAAEATAAAAALAAQKQQIEDIRAYAVVECL